MNHGKELEKLVINDKRTQDVIAKKMGYSRMTLNRLFHSKKFSPKQMAVVGRVYDAGLITGTTEVKPSVKSQEFGSGTIKKLTQKIAELEGEVEGNKNDLRNLNKKFNDLVFSLATGTKKGGKVPASQRNIDLFNQH